MAQKAGAPLTPLPSIDGPFRLGRRRPRQLFAHHVRDLMADGTEDNYCYRPFSDAAHAD